jgi:hypothetical protein
MAYFSGQMKQVFRRLGRAPMFTFIAVLTLALGIGANTAIFSVLEGVLLKPLPYRDPDRLVGLHATAPGVASRILHTFSLRRSTSPTLSRAARSGAQPALGRLFSAKDDSPGSPETLILSYGYWQRRFHGDPSILGRHLQIDGKSQQVIGVMRYRRQDLPAISVRPGEGDLRRFLLQWRSAAQPRRHCTTSLAP